MPVDHTKNIIEIKNVSFSYGKVEVLKNINLNIHQGDYLGIIGPNGSGKSTLLKLMIGLLHPKKGEIKLFDKKIASFRDWSKLGYVPQKAVSFDTLFPATVYEVAAMGRYGKKGLLKRLNSSDEKIINNSLEQVEMLEYKDRLIGELSGGQQQRVFIARALAGEPEVIFLDEPTTGVDVEAQDQFYALLKKLNRDLNLTLVMISHDLDIIAKQVTEVACVNQTLTYHDNPKEYIKKGEYIQELYGKNAGHLSHRH